LESLRIENAGILWSIGIFHICLVYFRPFGNVVVIWYNFPSFGILCQEKSGNPASVVVRVTEHVENDEDSFESLSSFSDNWNKLKISATRTGYEYAGTLGIRKKGDGERERERERWVCQT
jgi:hypothetical protein